MVKKVFDDSEARARFSKQAKEILSQAKDVVRSSLEAENARHRAAINAENDVHRIRTDELWQDISMLDKRIEGT